MSTAKSNFQLIISILISLAIAICVESQVFVDKSAINDDVRNQIYWMAQQNDPELFQNDLIAGYFSQASTVSPVVKAIYGLFPTTIDPKVVSQFLPFLLVALATLLLFKFAETIAGPRYAFWLCFIFNIYIWMVSNIPGALPRAFFYPLLFSFFYFYTKQQWMKLAIILALQVYIYPVVFYISALTLILELMVNMRRKVCKTTQIYGSALAIFVGLFSLYFRFAYKYSSDFGPLTSVQEALAMPEFFIKGRIKAFLLPYELLHANPVSKGILVDNYDFFVSVLLKSLIVIPLIIVSVFLYRRFIKPRVGTLILPGIFYTCVSSALVLFLVASFTLFYFYLPSRYLEYCLPLISIFVIGAFIYQLESIIPRLNLLFAIAVIIVSIIIVSPSWRPGLKSLDLEQQEIYSYISTLPKTIMIAAPYSIASNVPAYAYRSVIVSHEAYIPFHKEYYQEMQRRRDDLRMVYRANDKQAIVDYIKKYNIDYFIVTTPHKGKRSFLNSLPPACVSFANHGYMIISRQKLLSNCYN